MRPIDADNVLKALGIFNDREHGDPHFLNGIETAREIVEQAPTVDAEPVRQWISVKDRLPEKNGRYLCRYEQEVYGEVCRCTDFGMFDSDIGEKGGWLVGKVTHWMTLPEPPEDGDGNAR